MLSNEYEIKLIVYAIAGALFFYYGWRKVFPKNRKRITQEELDDHDKAIREMEESGEWTQ